MVVPSAGRRRVEEPIEQRVDVAFVAVAHRDTRLDGLGLRPDARRTVEHLAAPVDHVHCETSPGVNPVDVSEVVEHFGLS